MRVYSISEAGHLKDITEETHCISGETRVLKAAATCTLIYVDGSEKRGADLIEIFVHYNQLIYVAEFRIWFPKLPIVVALKDPILNRINDWVIPIEKDKNSGINDDEIKCENRWQSTEVNNK